MEIFWIETEGWVTEEHIMWSFIQTVMKKQKEYEIFKSAIVEKVENVG